MSAERIVGRSDHRQRGAVVVQNYYYAKPEQKIDRLALRSELVEVKERVHALEQRIAETEL